MKDRDIERYKRKLRHWGLHGHDRVGWIVNKAFRNIVDHYYYRDWNYFPEAKERWEAFYERRKLA